MRFYTFLQIGSEYHEQIEASSAQWACNVWMKNWNRMQLTGDIICCKDGQVLAILTQRFKNAPPDVMLINHMRDVVAAQGTMASRSTNTAPVPKRAPISA